MQRSMWGVVRIFMVLSSLLLICAAAVTEGSKQRYLTVRFFPAVSAMLAAEQREIQNQNLKSFFMVSSVG